MKFSASLINTWMKCPLQAKFSNIIGLPQIQNGAASFGVCVHKALEHFNTDFDKDAAVEWFLYYWENPEVLGVEPDMWPKRTSWAGYREKGIDMIYTYAESADWRRREVVGVEHRFMVPFGEHYLSGIVDLIEFEKNKLKIVDFKTNSRQPNFDSLYLNIQMTIYVYASQQPEFWLGYDDGTGKYKGFENGQELYDKYKRTPRVAIWHHLNNNKEINCGPRDDKDYMRLYRCCEEIVKAVEHDVFVPSINGETCTFCSYTEICNAFIPPHESGKAFT